MTPGIAVYAGISLTREAVETSLPHASLEQPIRRGDIYRDFQRGTRCFLIVDGEFDQSWAVSAGEILDVIRAGGVVYGSSSMGALRAAEVARYGMTGVGKIFQLIQATPRFMDDWLGHLFDPFTLQLITLPFVEFLFALERDLPAPLARCGQDIARRYNVKFDALDLHECHSLIDRMRLARAAGAKRDIERLFSGKRPTQKRKDAIALMRLTARRLEHVARLNARLR
jgi:hypothetical protein